MIDFKISFVPSVELLSETMIFKIKLNLSKLKKYLLLTHIREYYHFIFNKNELFISTKTAIDEVLEHCKLNNCNVHVGLLRSSNFWDPRFFYSSFRNSLVKYLNNFDLKLIEFNDVLNYKDRANFAPSGPHFSLKGYKLVSNRLLYHIQNSEK